MMRKLSLLLAGKEAHLPPYKLTVPADSLRYARPLFQFLLDRAAEGE